MRCRLCWNVESARLVPAEDLLSIVGTWLQTPFDGGRHARRIALIDG